jgi:hypothetical protein
MNSTGILRPRAPSTAESTLFVRTSFLARLGGPFRPSHDRGESERTRRRSSTSATDVKVEHTRSGSLPRPPALITRAVDHRRPRAAGTGYPAGSRAPALPVASTRPSFGVSREACSNRRRAPLSDNGSVDEPGEAATAPCPKARLRPAARTVRPSNEPGYLHTARNRDSSHGLSLTPTEPERKRPFFTRATG